MSSSYQQDNMEIGRDSSRFVEIKSSLLLPAPWERSDFTGARGRAGEGVNLYKYLLISINLLAVLIVPLTTDAATSVNLTKPPNNLGLVGYWTFDGPDMSPNVRDKSGNGRHGLLKNFTSTTTAAGKQGQALEFDGTNDYVDADHGITFDNQMTITAWVYLDTYSDNDSSPDFGNRNIINSNDPNNTNIDTEAHGIAVDDTSNGLAEGRLNWDVSTDSSNRITVEGDVVPLGEWHHIVFTVNAGSAKIYQNGTERNSGTYTDNGIEDPGQWKIGKFSKESLDGFFDGLIDDVRIYNRALSAQEIKNLYNSGVVTKGSSRVGVSDGLKAHYTFDGPDTLTNIADSSGSGLDGYLSLGSNGNTATSSISTRGIIGQAFSFDGNDDFIELPTGNNFYPTADQPFTITAWARYNSGAGAIFWMPDSKFSSSGLYMEVDAFDNWSMLIDGSGGTTNLEIGSTPGEWSFLTAIYDGDKATLYLNAGSPDTATGVTANAGVSDSGGEVEIGSKAEATIFDGEIDDVRFYDRALSLNEITRIYENTKGDKQNITMTPAGSSLEQGLVGHWTMDGPDTLQNIADVSGNGNHGGLEFGSSGNTSTSSMQVTGKLGQALEFDGSDDSVDMPNVIKGLTELTLSTWVNLSSADSDHDIYNRGTHNTLEPFIFWFDDESTDVWSVLITDSSGDTTGALSSATEATTEEWVHLSVTFVGDSKIRLFINGTEDANSPFSASTVSDISTDSDNERIARAASSNAKHLHGLIDDVRIYDRALTDAEIQRLYQLGR